MLRHYSFAALGQIAQAGLALVGLVAITRILGPGPYGTFVVVGTVVTLLSIGLSAGPTAAVLILSARNEETRADLHGQIVVLVGALSVIVAIATALGSAWLGRVISPSLEPVIVMIALLRLPALVYTALVTAQLSGAGRVGLAAVLNTISAALGLAGLFGAVVAADPLAGAIVGTTIATVASGLMMAFVALSVTGIAIHRSRGQWREVTSIAVPLHLGTMAYWVMLRADAIAVNSLLGAHSAGIYGLALQLSERVGLLTQPVYNATAWRVSGPDRREALRVALQVARLELALGVVAAVAAVVLGRLATTLIGGSSYAEAALPLAVLVLGAATLPVWSVVGLFLVSHLNGAWITTLAQIGVALVAILGYWTLTPVVGLIGPALVSTGAYLALVGTGLWLIHRHEPIAVRDLVPGRRDVDTVRDALRRLTSRS
jgi:O-antigen/teichoic acid export membrane protein